MKRSLLICLLGAISSGAFAQGINSRQLLQLQPNTTTMSEVEKAFGKAPKQFIDKERARWNYEQDGYHVSMDWSNDRLMRCTFTTKAKDGQWNKENNKVLDIGADVKQVIEKLGMPTDMSIEPSGQLVRYAYQNNTLNLSFKEGKLLRYEMNGTVSKL